MKYTFFIILILISFFVKSQSDTLKIIRNRFMLDFGVDYNLSSPTNYCNIDTNILKENIDPSSSMLYKEKSNYFTFHIGSIYNYQFQKYFIFETGVLYNYKKIISETNLDRLTQYNSFFDFDTKSLPLRNSTFSHSINIPLIMSLKFKNIGISFGLNNWLLKYEITRFNYNNHTDVFEEFKFASNFFDSLYFFENHSIQLGLSYDFSKYNKPVIIYANIERWKTIIIQIGLRYVIF